MDQPTSSPPSFFDAFLGLLSTPRSTLDDLLDQPKPPFIPGLLLVLIIILLGPIAWQLMRWDFLQTRSTALGALGLILCLTSVIFIPLELALLRLWRLPFSFSQVAALFTYCCTPLAVMALCYYGLNLVITQGRLTIATFLITGVRDADDWLVLYFPYVQLLAKAWFVYLYFCGLKHLGNMRDFSALLISILSAVPFYISVLAAIYITGLFAADSIQGVLDLLLSFRTLY